jgi:ribosome-binding ATPase YchF (GTP1/OBG family)
MLENQHYSIVYLMPKRKCQFSHIEPNMGVVNVPDSEKKVEELVKPGAYKWLLYIVDIAGLVRS